MKKILLFLLAFALVHVSCTRDVEYGEYNYISSEPFDASTNAGVTVFGYPNTEPLTVGQVTPDGQGMVFWVDPSDNTCGKAISLSYASTTSFSTVVDTCYIFSTINGYANTQYFLNAVEDQDNLNAINYCTGLGDYWYLPALQEWKEVMEVYNNCAIDYVTVARPYAISAEELVARAAFDTMLVRAGGAILNNDKDVDSGLEHWTSSEDPDAYGYQMYLRFGYYGVSSRIKSRTSDMIARGMQIIGSFTYDVETDGILNLDTKTITIEQDRYSSTAIPFETTFALSSIDISWDDDGDASWLDVSINDTTIVFTALEANEGVGLDGYRTTYVLIEAGNVSHSVKVSQYALPDYLSDGYVGYENFNNLTVGQLSPDGKGMVYWVSPDDSKVGKAISLQAIPGNFSYVSNDPCGATSTYNGMFNTYTYADDVDGAAYAKELGDHWYIPSHEELMEMYSVYNGNYANTSSYSYQSNSNLTYYETASRNNFNAMLTALGGSTIGTNCCIWSSTEVSETDGSMKYVRFDEYEYLETAGKTSVSSYFYRPIQIIGNHTFTNLVSEYIALGEGSTKGLADYQMDQAAGTKELDIYTESESVLISISSDATSWLEVKADLDTKKLTVKTTEDNGTGATRSGTVALTISEDVTEVITVYQKTTIASDKMSLAFDMQVGDSEDVTIDLGTYTTPTVSSSVSWASASISDDLKTLTVATTEYNSSANRTGSIILSVEDGSSLTVSISQGITRTVKGYESPVALTVGQITPDSLGIVYYVDPDNATYGLALSLAQVDGTQLFTSTGVSAAYTAGLSLYQYCGYANCEDVLNWSDYLATECPAYAWVDTLSNDNTWYIPARYELTTMLASVVGDQKSVTGLDGTLYDAIDKYGGDQFSVDGTQYYSSSIYSTTHARMARFTYSTVGYATGYSTFNLSAAGTRHVRAIQILGEITFTE